MSTVSGPAPRQSNEAASSWIGSLFTFDSKQLNLFEGVINTLIVIAPLLLLGAFGHAELWLSFSFGALYTRLARVAALREAPTTARVGWSMAFVLVGTLLTALGYILGGAFWPVVVLAVLISTFLSYLLSAYGQRGAVAGVLLNVWFLVALSVTFGLDKPPADTWPLAGPQALAWLAGGLFWLLVAAVWRMFLKPPPQADSPTSGPNAPAVHLSRPLVSFAGLAAVAIALATAVAWSFHIPNADWMPVSAVVAMKPRFDASARAAAQRVAGALLGAILAATLLTVVHDQSILILLIVVLAVFGDTIHDASYAFYCLCISTAVLIAMGLPHPGNLAD
jgi:hypothetical protein